MAPIWRSKNDEDTDNTSSPGKGNRESDNTYNADERSRLLSHPNQEGYLSPDDPAVTPYNLWSVRFLRYLSIIFASLTWVWWVLTFVSIFVTPPGLNSRGPGFYSLSFTSLTLSLLLTVLLFFSIPSKAAQITCISLAVILLIDTIIILSVHQIRVEEGWIGITSVVWILLMSIWALYTDRIVSWGKHGEEERLTGRQETRRTLLEWLAVFSSTIVLVAIAILAFLLSCNLILRASDSSLGAPGKRYFVDGDKYQIHLFCSPQIDQNNDKSIPTVLFESDDKAFMAGMNQIAESAIKNGSISRYCYIDRPGIGWSDNSPSPFSAGMSTNALSEALAYAGEEGPWVLVSAGIGSIYSRVFSSRHNGYINGILMIDPLHEDFLDRLSSSKRGFMLWIKGIISPLELQQILGATFKGRSREDRVFGRSAHQGGKYLKAMLQESLVAATTIKSEVQSAKIIQSQDVPLVIISSGIEVKRNNHWEEKQRDLTHLTSNLIGWDIVNEAPSEVWHTKKGRDVIEKRLKSLVQT